MPPPTRSSVSSAPYKNRPSGLRYNKENMPSYECAKRNEDGVTRLWLKNKPFVAMLSGQKKSEYRRRSPWIEQRLFETAPSAKSKREWEEENGSDVLPWWYLDEKEETDIDRELFSRRQHKKCHYIEFSNAYEEDAPKFAMEYLGVKVISGLPNKNYWNGLRIGEFTGGDGGEDHYEILLGDVVWKNKKALSLLAKAHKDVDIQKKKQEEKAEKTRLKEKEMEEKEARKLARAFAKRELDTYRSSRRSKKRRRRVSKKNRSARKQSKKRGVKKISKKGKASKKKVIHSRRGRRSAEVQ